MSKGHQMLRSTAGAISQKGGGVDRVSKRFSTASELEAFELAGTAAAYVDSAQRLCDSFIEDEYDRSLHYHKVVLFLTRHAIEVCCKAWLTLQKIAHKKNHDLATLHDQYCEAMPPIPLPLPTVLKSRISRTYDLFDDLPSQEKDLEHDQLRYAFDRAGDPYPRTDVAPLRELKMELDQVAIAIQDVQLTIWRRVGFLRKKSPEERALVLATLDTKDGTTVQLPKGVANERTRTRRPASRRERAKKGRDSAKAGRYAQ
jgi:hypothetical protein